MKIKEKISAITKNQWILYICLALYLIIALSLYAFTTSPLYPNDYGWDSAYYRFIGKSMLEGKTPYVDIWDNKGIVLYFIQALGAINGTNNGKISFIYLMQIAGMLLSTGFLYCANQKINKYKNRNLRFFILVIFAETYLCTIIEGGNLTEDWSIPMICCSLYLFTSYAANVKNELLHPRKYAFIHGICLGLVFFIRVNNCISICMGVLVIGCFLFLNRQWKNILENILFGLLGFGLICAPVIFYLLSNEAFGEMIHAVFINGLKLAGQGRNSTNLTGVEFFIRYAPIIISYIFIVLKFIKNKSFCFLDMIITAIVTGNALFFVKHNAALHYFIIYVPVFLYAMIVYLDFSYKSVIEILISFCLFFYSVSRCIEIGKVYFRPVHDPRYPTASLYIPKAERNSAIAVDIPADIYLQTGIKPCSRFAAYQTGQFSIDPDLKKEFIKSIESANPRWIIALCDKKDQMDYISGLIDEKYEYRFSDVPTCFYHLIEP